MTDVLLGSISIVDGFFQSSMMGKGIVLVQLLASVVMVKGSRKYFSVFVIVFKR